MMFHCFDFVTASRRALTGGGAEPRTTTGKGCHLAWVARRQRITLASFPAAHRLKIVFDGQLLRA
jgi:hypothetical protein